MDPKSGQQAELKRLETQDSLLGERKAEQWQSVANRVAAPSYGDAGKGRRILFQAPHGYWMETTFATQGRPWPRVLLYYAVYAVGAVCFAMTYALDEDGDPTFICDPDIFSISIMTLLYLIVFRTNSACVRRGRPLTILAVACRLRVRVQARVSSHSPSSPRHPSAPPCESAHPPRCPPGMGDGSRAARRGARS